MPLWGSSSPPKPPSPGAAAAGGIAADTANQPFNYLINAAATTGQPITLNGQTYDFSGLGTAQTAGKISDQMAATLLSLQQETDPTIIQQRLDALKAADPTGYAARQQLFDKIISDSQANPGNPVSQDLQTSLQNELAKGAGFSGAREEQQARDSVRGNQVASGIYLGAAPTTHEAQGMVQAGEQLQSQRQQDAESFLGSGADPNQQAYNRMMVSLNQLGSFVNGQTPQQQITQVGQSSGGPTQYQGGAPSTAFNQNAAGGGLNNALGTNSAQMNWWNANGNPWLTGASTAISGVSGAVAGMP